METMTLSLSIPLFFFFLFLFLLLRRRRKNSPPSPPSLPLLGHLHLLQKPLHRSLASLSARHGPILSLRFGSRPALLVSSASAAASCFSQNDAAFADRPRLLAGKHLGYNYSTLVWAPHGPHWRHLRRITALHILAPSRLLSFSDLRFQQVAAMVEKVGRIEGIIELRPRLFELNLNLMMKMVAGRRRMDRAEEFREIVRETFEVSGATNLGDFIPLLRLFDYKGGLEKRLVGLQGRRNAFLQELIDEQRREERGRKCLIDTLLSMQETDPEQYSDEIIKGIVVVSALVLVVD